MSYDEDQRALAAEYVLGTLDADERVQVEILMRVDAPYAALVHAWERRLGELHIMVDPVEPPETLWPRIKAAIAPPPAPEQQRTDPNPDLFAAPLAAALATPAPPTAEAAAVSAGDSTDDGAEGLDGDVADELLAEPDRAPAHAADDAPAPALPLAAAPDEDLAADADTDAAAATAHDPGIVSLDKLEDDILAATAAETAAASQPAAAPALAAMRPPDFGPAQRGAANADFAAPVRRWRAATFATTALAAVLAALLVVEVMAPQLLPDAVKPPPRVVERVKTVQVPSPAPGRYTVVLQKDAESPAFLLTVDIAEKTLTARRVGAAPQAQKSYELWLVSNKFPAPRSLGLIGAGEFTRQPTLSGYDAATIHAATFAVSLEPEGGSPRGAPTGPVLWSGKLVEAVPPIVPPVNP